MTPEAVKANWKKICDFENASKPQSIQGKESPHQLALVGESGAASIFFSYGIVFYVNCSAKALESSIAYFLL